MKSRKLLAIAAIPIVFIGTMWLLTKSFDLISAPSDLSVLLGFALLGITIAVISYTTLFIKNEFFKP